MRKKTVASQFLGILSSIKDKQVIEKELKRKGLRLSFPPEIEWVFQRYYFQEFFSLMKTSLFLGVIIFASFGVLDFLIYRDIVWKLWLVRYAVGCPIIILTLLYLIYSRKKEYYQAIASLSMFAIGLTILILLIITSKDPSQKYYAGLVLATFYDYVVLGLRFRYAAAAGWAIALAYFIVSSLVIQPDLHFLIGNTFTLFFANIIGMIGNYLFENSIRRNFLLSVLLNIEREELKSANIELEKLSNTDSLTGVANRRYFEDFLEREWKHAMRYGYPISLLMIDIDYFKKYNDHLGHQEGDKCLIRLASVLRKFERRPGDLVARYGGEEFVVILSGTALKDAVRIAEEIRKQVMKLKFLHPESEVSDVVTVSIGVSSRVPEPGESKEELIKTADLAMYRAKAMGRNCVNALNA